MEQQPQSSQSGRNLFDDLLAAPIQLPVEGADYHCHRFKAGEAVPPHFARTAGTKNNLRSIMRREPFLARWQAGTVNPGILAHHAGWAAVPGKRPKKDWGEVCL